MFSYQSSWFSLPLSRDSYIRLSHPFLFVNHFFHLFSSNFCGGPSSQCGKAVLRIVTLRCFVLTVISGTCYILSSRLINVNNFFYLFFFFISSHVFYCFYEKNFCLNFKYKFAIIISVRIDVQINLIVT